MANRTRSISLLLALLALAQSPLTCPAADAPTSQPDPAADRLTFLTLQLSSIEASLNAVNSALRIAGYKSVASSGNAEYYAHNNTELDRNGGGPISWDKFYGKTAKEFAPRDIYGVPHNYQRPDQFDYMYKANNDQIARANADVSNLSKKIDDLLTRRRQLDSEQSALWAKISWESIQNHEIPFNPLYRFQLKAAASTPASDARRDILRPTILFLRTIDKTVADDLDSLHTNQDQTLTDLSDRTQSAYTAARESLANALLSADLSPEDMKTARQLLDTLKRFPELSKNITESYHLALDGDTAHDDNRKLTFRAQLQSALLDYAGASTDLDYQLTSLAKSWGLEPQKGIANPDSIPTSTTKITAAASTLAPSPEPGSTTPPSPASPNAQPTTFTGTLSLILPGPSYVQLFVNGKEQFPQDAAIQPTVFGPLTLSTGDCLAFRSKTPDEYRCIQFAFVTPDHVTRFVSLPGDSILHPVKDPAAAILAVAPSDGTPTTEDRTQHGATRKAWHDAGLPTDLKLLQLPRNEDLYFTVHFLGGSNPIPAAAPSNTPLMQDTNTPADSHKINLLKLADLSRDVSFGNLTWDHNILLNTGRSLIQFPYAPPAEYDYHIVLTPMTVNNSVDLICSEAGKHFLWVVGAWGNTTCGFSDIDGKASNENPSTARAKSWLTQGQMCSLLVKVRKGSIEASLNNVVISSIKTDYKNIDYQDMHGNSKTVDPKSLKPEIIGIFFYHDSLKINSAEVTEITGHGQFLRKQ